MPARSGQIQDRGVRGIHYLDKPIKLRGASFIDPLGSVVVFEDFTGDAINTFQTVITEGGTATAAAAISATAGVPTAGHGGWLAFGTDDVDNKGTEIAVGFATAAAGAFVPARAGNGMLVCEWRWLSDAVTARAIFAGVSDDATEGDADIGAVGVATGTTVTAVADDAAGFVQDSRATSPTVLKGVSVDSTTVSAITAASTAVADQPLRTRVEIDSTGEVYFYSGTHASQSMPDLTYHGASDVGVSPDVAYGALLQAYATTTTAVVVEIDYALIACAR